MANTYLAITLCYDLFEWACMYLTDLTSQFTLCSRFTHIPILPLGKLRHRAMTYVDQHHTGTKWQNMLQMALHFLYPSIRVLSLTRVLVTKQTFDLLGKVIKI